MNRRKFFKVSGVVAAAAAVPLKAIAEVTKPRFPEVKTVKLVGGPADGESLSTMGRLGDTISIPEIATMTVVAQYAAMPVVRENIYQITDQRTIFDVVTGKAKTILYAYYTERQPEGRLY